MDTHPSAAATEERRDESLAGKRVAFAGRLAGMSRRDAQQLIREHGGVAVDAPAADAQIIVVGEQDFPLAVDSRAIDLDDATRSGVPTRSDVSTRSMISRRPSVLSFTTDPLPSPSIRSTGLSITSPKLLPIDCRRFSTRHDTKSL